MRTHHRSARARRPVATLAALVVLVTALHGGAAGAAPATILTTDRTGDDVVVTPRVLRTTDRTAEVDVDLGTDATGDAVVSLRLAVPVVDTTGAVTIGSDVPPGEVTPGSRLRPGERLGARVTGVEVPTLVVADVAAVDGTTAATPAAALLLPGPVGDPPTIAITARDGVLEATVSTATPLLVTARVRGDTTETLPDRLVLPDQPLVLTTPAAGWPLPSEIAVTDEAGRTVTATTGATALALLALTLVVIAAAALTVTRRRHRPPPATSPDPATGGHAG